MSAGVPEPDVVEFDVAVETVGGNRYSILA
ncbi:Uncharacterised protein [Mycobacteroides abscessus subsp. abscessus]|nr:Uncharacterised protein [Mycobacteroides abscessus subsp. abscessus]